MESSCRRRKMRFQKLMVEVVPEWRWREDAGAASEAEVPAFIDFIVKDIPSHQLPIRGGLMWLEGVFLQ